MGIGRVRGRGYHRGFVVYRGNASRLHYALTILHENRARGGFNALFINLVNRAVISGRASRPAPSFPLKRAFAPNLHENRHSLDDAGRAACFFLFFSFFGFALFFCLFRRLAVFDLLRQSVLRPITGPKQDSLRSMGNQSAPAYATRTGVRQVYEQPYNYADYNLSIGPAPLNDSRHGIHQRPASRYLN